MRLFSILLISAISMAVSATPIPDDGGPMYPPRTLMPNYIIPIYQANPTLASSTQYTAEIRFSDRPNEIRTIFGFDMPVDGPMNCRVKMTLSPESRSNWGASGSGIIKVYSLSNNPQVDFTTVSWEKRPGRSPLPARWTIMQPITGGDAVVSGAKIPCPRGGRLWLEFAADPAAGATSVTWFELINPLNGATIEMSNSP